MSRIILALVGCLLVTSSILAADWQPVEGPPLTRFAKDVSPEKALPEYPRPNMVREAWQNLNGLWDYAIRPKDAARPAATEFDGKILVPFAAESALSGVMKPVGGANRLWYRRTFARPKLAAGERCLLHFGAVDWEATVSVNGKAVGDHRGGYDPFSFDVTSALTAEGEQEIVVSVWDPTDASFQPRGKQIGNPHGIWYTAVTGIWQTVWLETVPGQSIGSLRITPDIDQSRALLAIGLEGEGLAGLTVQVTCGEKTVSAAGGKEVAIELPVPNAKLWSPDSPHLYDVRVALLSGGKSVDSVASYFGMRKIEMGKADDGFNRLLLNGKALFQFGPLDQGWWPDGLYTAPTDEALRYDIEMTRKLGFNMARKHVKVEPARWYYWCDKLGLMVWQDMPSGDQYIGPQAADAVRSEESAANFRREWRAIIDARRHFPSIVAWVPFNEGWGQFDTDEVLASTKKYDPTRLVDGPSGWTDRGTGDMHDMHKYPGPGMPAVEPKRAAVLGEFGGLGWPVEGHLWWKSKRNWGYRNHKSQGELERAYEGLIRDLRPLVGKGLAAAVYTQTTDVEGEVNGLMTYDRAIVKLDAERIAKLHAKLYQPMPKLETKTIVPTGEEGPQTWRYTMTAPGDDDQWTNADFDDSKWQEGPSGFGGKATPTGVARTEWLGKDIWLRRAFDFPAGATAAGLQLRIQHDDNAKAYLNGSPIATLGDYTTEYVTVELDDAAKALLKPGRNVLSIHCHQDDGGQFIDAGLIDVREIP